ncbi:hypothetical protein COU60_01215 [Candidatus Pacearchaeota archaeon CG10_big_fil_rev_8_21_14_0_10_34_76]|nr:MAG: hypothetical protein COU60_01215 [Candidatus Pacearchaeota archaeon CG10_big_fil_rev_8_21_14_0_10_34_76]
MKTYMETSFGSLEPLLEHEGKLVAELATFHKEGRSHTHDDWEICYVIKGEGIIISGENKHGVKEGSVVLIPPKTGHWMIQSGDKELKILLVYSKNR